MTNIIYIRQHKAPAFVLAVMFLALLCVRPAAAQSAGGGSVLDDPLVQYQAKRGLDLLYDMRFEQSYKLFDQIDRRFPRHPIGPFLKALNTWWEILLDMSDDSHDDAFFAAMDEVIARSDRLLARDQENFDAMFFKGAALGFRGRLRSNRGDWFKAAMDGKRAMDYVLAVAKKDPGNHDYVFGKGLYDYYAAVIPDRYPFTKTVMVFFPKGNRERGIQELQRTAEKGTYIQTEAAYFLLQVFYLFEDDYEKSVEYATWLRERHPANPFFHTFEGRVYVKWGRWQKAEEIFSAVVQRYQQGLTGYNAASAEQSYYFLSRSRMALGDYEQALEYLKKLDTIAARTSRDTYFKVWGRFRQGMAYDALGRRDMAVKRYKEVLAMKDWGDVHERAQYYLDEPHQGRNAALSYPRTSGQ